jgi:hypothetical protein
MDLYEKVIKQLSNLPFDLKESEELEDSGTVRQLSSKASSILGKWWITLLVVPIGASLISSLLFLVLSQKWIPWLFVEVISIIFGAYGLIANTTPKLRRKLLVIALAVGLILLYPGDMATLLEWESYEGLELFLLSLFLMFMPAIALSLLGQVVVLASARAYVIGKYLAPVVPATVGNFSPKYFNKAYGVVEKELEGEDNVEVAIVYLSNSAQAILDSAEVRILPWVTLLALPFIESNITEVLSSSSITFFSSEIFLESLVNTGMILKGLIFVVGLLALFNMALQIHMNTTLIQVLSKISYEREIDKTEKRDVVSRRSLIFGYESVRVRETE